MKPSEFLATFFKIYFLRVYVMKSMPFHAEKYGGGFWPPGRFAKVSSSGR